MWNISYFTFESTSLSILLLRCYYEFPPKIWFSPNKVHPCLSKFSIPHCLWQFQNFFPTLNLGWETLWYMCHKVSFKFQDIHYFSFMISENSNYWNVSKHVSKRKLSPIKESRCKNLFKTKILNHHTKSTLILYFKASPLFLWMTPRHDRFIIQYILLKYTRSNAMYRQLNFEVILTID